MGTVSLPDRVGPLRAIRCLGDIERLFVEVLLLAREMGMLSLAACRTEG